MYNELTVDRGHKSYICLFDFSFSSIVSFSRCSCFVLCCNLQTVPQIQIMQTYKINPGTLTWQAVLFSWAFKECPDGVPYPNIPRGRKHNLIRTLLTWLFTQTSNGIIPHLLLGFEVPFLI